MTDHRGINRRNREERAAVHPGTPYYDVDGSDADLEASFEHTEAVHFQHPLGEVVSTLTGRDLELEFLHEFPRADLELYQGMERDDEGRWWLPGSVPVDLPLTFSLRAQKG